MCKALMIVPGYNELNINISHWYHHHHFFFMVCNKEVYVMAEKLYINTHVNTFFKSPEITLTLQVLVIE